MPLGIVAFVVFMVAIEILLLNLRIFARKYLAVGVWSVSSFLSCIGGSGMAGRFILPVQQHKPKVGSCTVTPDCSFNHVSAWQCGHLEVCSPHVYSAIGFLYWNVCDQCQIVVQFWKILVAVVVVAKFPYFLVLVESDQARNHFIVASGSWWGMSCWLSAEDEGLLPLGLRLAEGYCRHLRRLSVRPSVTLSM